MVIRVKVAQFRKVNLNILIRRLNEPAVTGRLDYRLIDQLRLGLSGYFGGIDNENKGGSDSVSGNISIIAADFDYTFQKFDFRGAIAHTDINDAAGLPEGTAEEMFGWYLESAYHFWPESFKQGKLADSDATIFVRYDRYDTQHQMPSGVDSDDRYDRSDLTVGVTFKPVHNLALKADYQFRKHEGSGDPDNMLNLGVGWEF